MTRDEIEALPFDKLIELLETSVLHREFSGQWRPDVNRNDLAELVAAVDVNYENGIHHYMMESFSGTCRFWKFLLTCDPLIACRAIAVACCGGDA